MRWSVNTLIPIFATIIYGVIFTLVLVSRPRTRLKQRFSIYLFAMIIWSISAFLTLSGLVDVYAWIGVMSAANVAMLLAFFFFVQTLFSFRRKWAVLAIVYGLLAIPIMLFTHLVFESASLTQAGAIQYTWGPLFLIVAAPGYSWSVICAFDLIKGLNRTFDAHQRNVIRYLLIAFSISILGTLTDFTPLGKYPVDIAANCVTAILIAYAILRHKLLDIQIIIRVGLVYSIVTAIYSGIYYLSISLLLTLFTLYTGKAVFYVSLLVGVVTAILLNPLRDLAQSWIDRLFYRDKYNAELMLQRLSRTTTLFVEIEKLSHLILSEIRDTMHIEHGAILIKHNESGDFQVIPENGEKKYFPSDFRADHPIVTWMTKNNRPLFYRDIAFSPIFKSIWKEESEELEKFNAEFFLPLNSNEELIGILALGKKLSSQPYTQNEELLFSTLANQTAVAVENARLYNELKASFIQSVTALANAIDIRDTYTITHSQQIANWAAKTAHQLGCTPDEVNEIYLGGMLHDIGKIGIPDSILQKPAKLTEEEWKIVRTHPTLGAELISPIKKLANVAPMVENSHERFDGLGYPHGKIGMEIPLGARIISVVDSYSAMVDTRPYKKPYSTPRIIEELKQNSGKMYDPMVVDAFLKVIQSEENYITSAEG
jgi:HD-GYP domain-containing protein (c-di-GMP phosphodiesterase class II)